MLYEILKDNIIMQENVSDWEESIKKASDPLEKTGKIEKRYIEAMINDIKQIGFYVVITDKVAMPHSRPENGVKETALSLLKLEKPVNYGEHEVNLVFILAAENKEKHIGVLKELSYFLDSDERIDLLINAKSIEEIEKFLKNRR